MSVLRIALSEPFNSQTSSASCSRDSCWRRDGRRADMGVRSDQGKLKVPDPYGRKGIFSPTLFIFTIESLGLGKRSCVLLRSCCRRSRASFVAQDARCFAAAAAAQARNQEHRTPPHRTPLSWIFHVLFLHVHVRMQEHVLQEHVSHMHRESAPHRSLQLTTQTAIAMRIASTFLKATLCWTLLVTIMTIMSPIKT